MRRRAAAVTATVAIALAGCAEDEEPAPRAASTEPSAAEVEAALDPALSLLPESRAAEKRLLRRLGSRADFRVPRGAVAPLRDGPLAHAVVARIADEIEAPERDDRWDRLTPGQRALHVLQWADIEILEGGFWQYFFNHDGSYDPGLSEAARLVGAREYEAVFSEAERLFPGGVPRRRSTRQRALERIDQARLAGLDERYAAFQYRPSTYLAPILARYVRANPEQFLAD